MIILLILLILIGCFFIYSSTGSEKESIFEDYKDDGLRNTNSEESNKIVEEHFEDTLSNEAFEKKTDRQLIDEKVVEKQKNIKYRKVRQKKVKKTE